MNKRISKHTVDIQSNIVNSINNDANMNRNNKSEISNSFSRPRSRITSVASKVS